MILLSCVYAVRAWWRQNGWFPSEGYINVRAGVRSWKFGGMNWGGLSCIGL